MNRDQRWRDLQGVRESLVRALLRKRVPAWDCEDVAQAALVELLLRGDVETLHASELLLSASQIARRSLFNVRRETRRRQNREQQSLPQATDPERLLLARNALVRFIEALEDLAVDQRRVVIACDVEGLSHAEAALALAIPLGTVKSRHRKARATLESAGHGKRREEMR